MPWQLSDSTYRKLQETIARVDRLETNARRLNRGGGKKVRPIVTRSLIVCKAPAGGVPAATTGSTGSAVCEFVNITTSSTGDPFVDLGSYPAGEAPQQKIQNLGPAIPEGQMFGAIPDQGGVEYYAIPLMKAKQNVCPFAGEIVMDSAFTDLEVVTAAWQEIIPPAIVVGVGRNVVLGANAGRLKVEYNPAEPNRLFQTELHFDLSVLITGTDQTVEFSFAINGAAIPFADSVRQVVQTGGQHTAGLSFPVSMTIMLDQKLADGAEFSVIARSPTGATAELLSYNFLIRGEESCVAVEGGGDPPGDSVCLDAATRKTLIDDLFPPPTIDPDWIETTGPGGTIVVNDQLELFAPPAGTPSSRVRQFVAPGDGETPTGEFDTVTFETQIIFPLPVRGNARPGPYSFFLSSGDDVGSSTQSLRIDGGDDVGAPLLYLSSTGGTPPTPQDNDVLRMVWTRIPNPITPANTYSYYSVSVFVNEVEIGTASEVDIGGVGGTPYDTPDKVACKWRMDLYQTAEQQPLGPTPTIFRYAKAWFDDRNGS